MRSGWDWDLMRRAVNQVGVVVIAASMVDAFLGSGDLTTSFSLLPFGIAMIGFSCLRRCKMQPIFWVVLATTISLLVLLFAAMPHNK